MAHRLPCRLFVSATLLLLLAGAPGNAQQPDVPKQPSIEPSKQAEPSPAAKELSAKLAELLVEKSLGSLRKGLSAQEVDDLIEKAFGKNSPERKRPIRLSVADLFMVLSAQKAIVAKDGRSVRFTSASAAIPSGEIKQFRGQQMTFTVEKPVKLVAELSSRRITLVEIHNGAAKTRLEPFDFVTAPFVNRFGRDTPLNEGGFQPEKRAEPLTRQVVARFDFKIDPKASASSLLPTPAKGLVTLSHWTNQDLAKVPELTFGELISKELPKHKAMETTAHVMAKINHLSATNRDGFMLAMIDKRDDLRGLPFLMGDDCRTREHDAKLFERTVDNVRARLAKSMALSKREAGDLEAFWNDMGTSNHSAQMQSSGLKKLNDLGVTGEQMLRAKIAALSQIMMPESAEVRADLAKFLGSVSHIDATKALARLAIFSPEDEVRAAAIEGLKLRREKDYTDVLMQGFRYPLPAVSKRAAEALVKLERKDLIANLVEVLESPDPRLPVTQKRDGNTVTFVRELVKVNHHRNCLLCHAPGNTADTPEGVLKVAVPLPGEPLPKPSEGGYQSTPPPSPDIVVRLDMTYLRQDFSVMMPVADAHPWPEMQRFDFLVRTRELTASEAQAYEPCCEGEEEGRLSPYHRAALYALRELTGRDTAPTAVAWRKLLKLPAR